MITFLPTPDFAESASMLDSKRLGNQRVEARMILRWLRDPAAYPRQQNAGYTIMWRGHEDALCAYYNACCEEWARRGGRNLVCQPERVPGRIRAPSWLGDDGLHATHRSALLHKLPSHYGAFGWGDEFPNPSVDYLWPRPVEGGREGEYELCPAFWKKKGEAKKSPTKKKKKGANKSPAKKKKWTKSPAKKNTESVKMQRVNEKERQRKGPASMSKREEIYRQASRRYPSRQPRRNARLAGK